MTLPNVTNAKRVKITITGINGVANATGALGFLLGNVDNNRSVSASDLSSIKTKSGQTVTSANFRYDINLSGSISASDISAVKAQSGVVLS